MRAKRIDNLVPGRVATICFYSGENEKHEETVFLGIAGKGDDRLANFRSTDEDGKPYVWSAYRYQGRWAYGTGADRLKLVDGVIM